MKKEKICGIYKIKNISNGKFYIGSSNDIYRRWNEHKRSLNSNNHPNLHLQNSWIIYGESNFDFIIIEKCNEDELLDLEQKYIDETKCTDRTIGYNIMPTTDMSKISEETKKRISETLMGKYVGENCFSSKYSEDIVKSIIEDLMNEDNSYIYIAKKYNVKKQLVYSICSHYEWAYLTKDIIFPKRGQRSYAKLDKNDILEIIELLQDNKSDIEISDLFNVGRKTISDIRNHKTWTRLTEGLDFQKSDGLKRGNDNCNNKLSYNQVKNIKEMLKNNIKCSFLAKEYNVSISTIYNIKKGKIYTYV